MGIIRTSFIRTLSLLTFTAVLIKSNALMASVSAPSTSTTGDFRITWTNTASSSSSVCTGSAYDIKEYKSGSYQRTLYVSSTSQKYIDITGRSSGTYRYDVRYRSCSASAKSMLSAGSDTISVVASSINKGFTETGYNPRVDVASNDATVGLTPGVFRVNESGAATYNIPLSVAAGRAGVQPELALAYSSHNRRGGNLGVGWSLSGLSAISRCPQNEFYDGANPRLGLHFDEDDRLCLDGERLIRVSGSHLSGGAKYRKAKDDHSVITAFGGNSTKGPDYFKVENKAGETRYYGKVSGLNLKKVGGYSIDSSDAFVEPGGFASGSVAQTYALKAIVDIKDNYILYNYHKDTIEGSFYLDSIDYSGHLSSSYGAPFATVEIEYRDFDKGFKRFGPKGSYSINNKLIDQINIKVDGDNYRSYFIDYEADVSPFIEEQVLIESVTECAEENRTVCRRPTTFEWNRRPLSTSSTVQQCESEPGVPQFCRDVVVDKNFDMSNVERTVATSAKSVGNTQVFDIDGNGVDDFVYPDGSYWKARLMPQNSIVTLASGTGEKDYALNIDWNGDGIRDLLYATSTSGNWKVVSYRKGTNSTVVCENNFYCESVTYPSEKINRDLGVKATGVRGQAQVMDVNGDGFEDIVYKTGSYLKAYLNNNGNGTFQNYSTPLYTYTGSVNSFELGIENVQNTADLKYSSAVDVNGDGKTDVIAKRVSTETQCLVNGRPAFAFTSYECRFDLGGTWSSSTTTSFELLLASGTQNAPRLTLQQNIGGASISAVRMADLNGDFLTDLLYVKSNKLYYRLSNGTSFESERDTGLVTDSTKKLLNRFVDINGDGRSDILLSTSSNMWAIYFSRPTNSAEWIEFEHRGFQSFDSNAVIQFGDVTGNGVVSLLTSTGSTWKEKYHTDAINEFSIKKITNGFGVDTNVIYLPLTNPSVYFGSVSDNQINTETFSPLRGMNVVRWVGDNTESYYNPYSHAGRGSIYYSYAGYLVHRKGLGSLGFQVVKSKDDLTQIESTTQYNQDYGADSYYKSGLPVSTYKKRGTQYLSKAENTLNVRTSSQGGKFAYIQKTEEESFILGSDNLSSSVNTVDIEFVYDSWGNLTNSSSTTTDSGTSDYITTTTVNVFGTNDTYKRYGRLTNSTVNKTRRNNGTTLPTVVRKSEFTYNSDLLLETTIRAPEDSKKKQTITVGYDIWGNRTSVQKVAYLTDVGTSQTRLNKTTFDVRGRYIKYKYDANNFNTYFNYNGLSADSVTGVITKIGERNQNYLYTYRYLTQFGAEYKVDHPDSKWAYTGRQFCSSGCPSGALYYVKNTVTGSPGSTKYFNKYGQEIEHKVDSFSSGYNRIYTAYDIHGRRESVSEPNSTNYLTEFIYDDLSRVEKIIKPNGEFTTQSWDGNIVTNVDELGRQSLSYKNGFGELAKSEDERGNTVTFEYDAYGNLLKSTTRADSKSSVVSAEFDAYGRKTKTIDPSKGTWNYTYNGFDELYSQTTAELDKFVFTYDKLGRKTRSYNAKEGTLCWVYGTSTASRERNQLIQTAKYESANAACGTGTPSIKTEFDYDSLGRVEGKSTTIAGITYLQTQTYDSASRALVTTFPTGMSAFSVKNLYTYDGYLKATINNETGYVIKRIDSMNSRGQVTDVTFGNNVQQDYEYDAETGRLSDVDVFKSGQSFYSLDLTYYDNDHVKTKRSKYYAGSAADFTETFTYDDLYRMTNRAISVSVSNAAIPTNFSTNRSFSYDNFGNITKKYGFEASGTTRGFYKYNSSKVHQLEGIYRYSNYTGTKFHSFAYDKNGNVKSDGVRTFSYQGFDKPTYISKSGASVTMKYGVDRQLYYKSETKNEDGSSATYAKTYVGAYEKTIRNGGHGTLTEHKYYVGGAVVTQRSDNTDDIHYMHKDNQGSVVVTTNHDGNLTSQSIFDPWGKSTSLYLTNAISSFNQLVPTERGYTSHRMLEDLNIIHMNGRVYDPTIGRFLQADPHIQAPENIQNYNRYSYVLNNPVNYTDPSGYFFKSVFKFVKKHWRTIAAIGIAFWNPGALLFNSYWAAGAATGFLSGAVSTGSLKGALVGAISGGMFGGLHNMEFGLDKIMMHGLAGGVSSLLGGGKFGHGFFAAGITQGLSKSIDGIRTKLGRVLAASALGGTVSSLTGGKFANGAITAAFSRALNDENTAGEPEESQVEYDCGNGADCKIKNPGMKPALEKMANNIGEDGKVVVTGGDSYYDEETGTVKSASTGETIKRSKNSFHNDNKGNRAVDIRSDALNVSEEQIPSYINKMSGGDFKVWIDLSGRYTNQYGVYHSDGHIHLTCNSAQCINGG